MTSNDIIDLLRSIPNHIKADMRKTVKSGAALWFVEDESGSGRAVVFRCGCGGEHKDCVRGSDELCDFLEIPHGEIWIGEADHMSISPQMGQKLQRHSNN